MRKLTLKEIQQIELNILIFFDEFCRKYDIEYSLFGGTLLGAVRHKGFIPWDDDIDVCMSRPNYEKFKLKMKTELFPKHYQLLCENQKGYLYPFCKMIDTRTLVMERGVNSLGLYGVWIDIFPLDGIPENEKKRKILFIRSSFWIKMHYFSKCNSIFIGDKFLKKIIKVPFVIISRFFGTKLCTDKILSLCKKYNYMTMKLCTHIAWETKFFCLKKKEFENIIYLLFENHYFQAISNWDQYLKMRYGSYMEMPPEEERKGHNIDAWIKEGEENNIEF